MRAGTTTIEAKSGYGLTPKVLLVFLLSFFPVLLNSIQAFKSVDPEIMDLARSTGASEWLMLRKIRLPQALPSIFTGLKVGAALAATAAVVAEFVASNRGLGYLLLEYNGTLETATVFAVVLVLSAIGLLVYYAVELLEKLAIPWHVSHRAAAGSQECAVSARLRRSQARRRQGRGRRPQR